MPLSLPELLESQQALEVIPGVLYFASLGVRLRSIAETVASASQLSGATPCSRRFQQQDRIEAAAATAALDASMSSMSSTIRRGRHLPQKQKHGHATYKERPVSSKSLRRARSNAAQCLLLMRQLLSDTNNDKDCGGLLDGDVFYFSVSESQAFQYRPFFADFGPLDISCVTRLSRCLQSLLEYCAGYAWDVDGHGTPVFGPRHGYQKGGHMKGFWNDDESSALRPIPVVFCSGLQNHKRANAACGLACFCVATLRWSASATWNIFQNAYPPTVSFRDASYGVSVFPLTLLDVISGLEKAVALQWYDARTFDVNAYERLRRYDCNWVVPNMFIAFSSPVAGDPKRSVEMYAKLFQELRVTHVIRLNEPSYKRETFLANGIRHVDLEFPDGTAPNDDIINRFMWTVEPILLPPPPLWQETKNDEKKREKGKKLIQTRDAVGKKTNSSSAIAVHCRAGLGRTGTLICVYMMQHYGFTARESIGWIRLCRPGSVIGVQQIFLERIERRLTRPTKESDILRAAYHTSVIGSGVVDDISHYAYQLHTLPPTTTTTSSSSSSSGATGTTMAKMNVPSFSATATNTTTDLSSSMVSPPSPSSSSSSSSQVFPLSLAHSSPTSPASLLARVSPPERLPSSELTGHTAEEQVTMVEPEAILSDAACAPDGSIMGSMGYPSSYFLMLEGACPSYKTCGMQNYPVTERQSARQSTLDHTTNTTKQQVSTPPNPRSGSRITDEMPPPVLTCVSTATATGAAAAAPLGGGNSSEGQSHDGGASNNYCNDAGSNFQYVRSSSGAGNNTNQSMSTMVISPHLPSVPLTPWRTPRTVANITPPRVQVMVRKSRQRKVVSIDGTNVFSNTRTLGTHRARLSGGLHRIFSAQTIGPNGEGLAAMNASARRLRVPLIPPPERTFLPLFGGGLSSGPRKPKRASLSLAKQASVSDPGWGTGAVRLGE